VGGSSLVDKISHNRCRLFLVAAHPFIIIVVALVSKLTDLLSYKHISLVIPRTPRPPNYCQKAIYPA